MKNNNYKNSKLLSREIGYYYLFWNSTGKNHIAVLATNKKDAKQKIRVELPSVKLLYRDKKRNIHDVGLDTFYLVLTPGEQTKLGIKVIP